MPLNIIRADITELKLDAIVNPSNKELRPTGGLDLSIRKKAGTELEIACKNLSPCLEGQIKVTKGYGLPCKYIFHTVGPTWSGGQQGEIETLASCYRNALKKAIELNLNSIALPLIATGNNLFPKDLALSVATYEISNFILNNELNAYLVVYDKKSYQLSAQKFNAIATYIDDNYIEEKEELRSARSKQSAVLSEPEVPIDVCCAPMPIVQSADVFAENSAKNFKNLNELLSHLDESFSDMLLRKIHEKGITAVQCYKRANIDKKLFSKIQSNRLYHPKKSTVLAFAIALELPLEEMSEMLQKAGFALSSSSKADIIVQYFVLNHNYNIFEINETLFAFDQQLIGG